MGQSGVCDYSESFVAHLTTLSFVSLRYERVSILDVIDLAGFFYYYYYYTPYVIVHWESFLPEGNGVFQSYATRK